MSQHDKCIKYTNGIVNSWFKKCLVVYNAEFKITVNENLKCVDITPSYPTYNIIFLTLFQNDTNIEPWIHL